MNYFHFVNKKRRNPRAALGFALIPLLVLLCLPACASKQIATPDLSPTPVMTSPADLETATATTAAPGPSPTPSPSPTPIPPDRPHYTLTAELDYPGHRLEVAETIDYTNRTPDPLIDLVLMVDPLYYPGTFQLDSMTWGDGQPIGDYQTETGWLRFPLPVPLQPGEKIQINLDYHLNLPSPAPNPTIRPIPFGYTDRQTNLVDWYPFVPPYQPGKGWLAHPAGYYGEHLAYESADFEVNLRMKDSAPDLIIAASAPAVKDGEWYRYKHDRARNFAWSASPYYQTLTAQAGAVQVFSYAFGGEAIPNQAVLQTTVEALQLYERLFGPYPRSHLAVVEADFLDGMEYDGLYFLSKGFYNLYQQTPGEYLITIAAHETAHQWWYARVGNDQAMEPWLDEALCTYSERLYYENIHPEALDWWWDYRVNYYQPRGWVDTNIYNPSGEANAYRAYRDAVYLNGAKFLEDLRQAIGDDAFFAFLKAYQDQQQAQIATADEFFSILEQHTPVDISFLKKQYFSK